MTYTYSPWPSGTARAEAKQVGLAFQMDFKHVDRFGDTDESDLFSQVFQQMTMGH